jgi:hypothetical protein
MKVRSSVIPIFSTTIIGFWVFIIPFLLSFGREKVNTYEYPAKKKNPAFLGGFGIKKMEDFHPI